MTAYDKADFWAIKAKKEGYPARSVYKLEEISSKFKLVKAGIKVLDIGAAPGSWSLWIKKQIGLNGFLAAVDLQELAINMDASNFFYIKGDIYDASVQKALLEKGPYDLVLSDAAPATSGNSGLDCSRSESIAEAVLDCADIMLKNGGSVVLKLFVGGGQKALLDRMKLAYTTVGAFKPKACRSMSFETYLVGKGKK